MKGNFDNYMENHPNQTNGFLAICGLLGAWIFGYLSITFFIMIGNLELFMQIGSFLAAMVFAVAAILSVIVFGIRISRLIGNIFNIRI